MAKAWKNPVAVPAGVEVTIDGQGVTVKGSKGVLERELHPAVQVTQEDGQLLFAPRS